MELQNIGARDVEGTISSSSEYSSDSDDDDDDTEDSDSATSSEQDGEHGLEAKDVNIVDQFASARPPVRKPSINKLEGISRAQILENVKNEATNGKKLYKDEDQLNDGGNNKPTDLSLAFIGCEDTDHFNQNAPLGAASMVKSSVTTTPGVPSNIRRKTSSLSQRYGNVRRRTSRGSMPMEGATANNQSENGEQNTGIITTKNKSLELDDIQLDEYVHNSVVEKAFPTKSQSPKILRPENKVILGDSSDNVSILTDGMLY